MSSKARDYTEMQNRVKGIAVFLPNNAPGKHKKAGRARLIIYIPNWFSSG
jgi:hypothetical protein